MSISFNPFNVAKSLINPATLLQIGMGPAGWASLAGRMVLSAIGQQAIQAVGERLGLPQNVIDSAQAAFCSACGDKAGAARNLREASAVLNEMGVSPRDQGNIQRHSQDAIQKFTNWLQEQMTRPMGSGDGLGTDGTPKSKLMKLAEIMGKLMDDKMDGMIKLGGEIDGMKKAGEEVMQKSSEMQALGQELGMLSAATSNVIKSIGEASSTLARKS